MVDGIGIAHFGREEMDSADGRCKGPCDLLDKGIKLAPAKTKQSMQRMAEQLEQPFVSRKVGVGGPLAWQGAFPFFVGGAVVDDRAARVGDVEFADLIGERALEAGEIGKESHQRDEAALQKTRGDDFGADRGVAQDRFGNRVALLFKTLEQDFLSDSSMDEIDFPGEVEGVLDRGVESLAAEWAVDVGGVAEKENIADAHFGGDAAVHGKGRHPTCLQQFD